MTQRTQRSSSRTRVGSSPATILNDRTAHALLIIVGLSAIPFGSNRPFFWALWALILGLTLTVYLISAARTSAPLRRPVSDFSPPAVMFSMVAGWMVFQMLPIGGLAGLGTFTTQTGGTVFSQTISLASGDTMLGLLKWLTYGALFFLVLQTGVRRNRARKVATMLMAIVTAEAVYSLIALHYLGDLILFAEKNQYQGSATGTFVNRNSHATFLSLGAVLAAALAMPSASQDDKLEARTSRRSTRPFLSGPQLMALGCLLILLTALFATNSRLGVLAGFTGLGVVLILRSPSNLVRIVFALFGLASAFLLVFLYGEGLVERLITLSGSSTVRTNIYTQVVQMIWDRPILGFGADTFHVAYPLYKAEPVATNLVYAKAHSTYLAHWVELGLFVGTLPLLVIAWLTYRLVRCALKPGGRTVEVCAALGAVATVATHSTMDFSLEIQAVTFLFLSILALGSSQALDSRPGTE